ncbi:HD domain-containing phosphohydrolase [Gallaecimonas sp. GXIMD1310]|uniref:HD domain-containing phosphohydrolase n=1 Tax=Gallaecimonas sp. GXIMD1310 TaxID=3131926 RepID=UPI00324C8501
MHSQALKEAHILVIDDIETNVLLMQDILSMGGYHNIHGITDPTQVPAFVRENPVDILLLDQSMPELSGLELFSLLKEEHYRLPPVLMITALNDQELRHRALASGIADFINKPFDIGEVLLRIENNLDRYFLQKTLDAQVIDLEGMVKQRTEELHESYMELLRCLAKAAEFRDNETGAHVMRIGATAKMLAEAIGCDKEYCEMLLMAAPMHDVGKIGIPDGILLKTGPLNEQEREVMKRHPAIGREILGVGQSRLVKMASEIALYHHEFWNGKGYPAGIAGEHIPLSARITSVCDVYDALRSVRPYKSAFSVEKAKEILADMAGGHLDPELTANFIGIIDKVEAYREELGED